MPCLTAEDLAALRSAAESQLLDTADIYRPPDPNTTVRNSRGEIDRKYPDNWTKTNGSTPVACRISESRFRADEKVTAEQIQAIQFYDIAFPVNVDMDSSCRVVIRSSMFNANLVGRIYDVKSSPEASADILKVTLCTLTEPGDQ